MTRVLVTPTTDSLGDDAFSVTVVVDDTEDLTGDDALDTIFGIDQALQKMGEHRIAITSFATESEMSANGDPRL